MAAIALRPHDARFVATRRAIIAIALAAYVLSFFHPTAPAAIATELARTFEINAAVLGTLAATYFYVYTVLQIPVGVLADTLGPRRLLAGGSMIAAAGSLMFALAPAWIRSLSAAGSPARIAKVSAVSPTRVRALTFAPSARSFARRSASPYWMTDIRTV